MQNICWIYYGFGSKIIKTEYNCDDADAPRVAFARFDDAVAQVLIQFDRITTMAGLSSVGTFPCWDLFEYASYVKLGGHGSVCSFTSTTTLQVKLGEVASSSRQLFHVVRRTACFRNEIDQFETRRDDHRLNLCHLPEGTSGLLVGLAAMFRGLCFIPK